MEGQGALSLHEWSLKRLSLLALGIVVMAALGFVVAILISAHSTFPRSAPAPLSEAQKQQILNALTAGTSSPQLSSAQKEGMLNTLGASDASASSSSGSSVAAPGSTSQYDASDPNAAAKLQVLDSLNASQ